MSQDHTSINCSVIGVELQGIVDLDMEVALHHKSSGKEIASLSMRAVLLKCLKINDTQSLFAEVHQHIGNGQIEAVIPNIPEAERMFKMMKKTYCWFSISLPPEPRS
jgi:hypothetical protein